MSNPPGRPRDGKAAKKGGCSRPRSSVTPAKCVSCAAKNAVRASSARPASTATIPFVVRHLKQSIVAAVGFESRRRETRCRHLETRQPPRFVAAPLAASAVRVRDQQPGGKKPVVVDFDRVALKSPFCIADTQAMVVVSASESPISERVRARMCVTKSRTAVTCSRVTSNCSMTASMLRSSRFSMTVATGRRVPLPTPCADELPRVRRRESRCRRSSPRGLCRPIEDDCDWLLEAATLGRNGEKPLSVRRHREVAPRCPLGHGEERCRRSELEHRRRPDGHRYEMPVVCEIEELPSGWIPAWKTASSRRYS